MLLVKTKITDCIPLKKIIKQINGEESLELLAAGRFHFDLLCFCNSSLKYSQSIKNRSYIS